jgi:predicted dinucleotide-utilizing enzyme
MHKIAMLGTGLIGRFYTQALHGQRRPDRVEMVYSRSPERAREFASKWGIPRHTTDLAEAIRDPETDVVEEVEPLAAGRPYDDEHLLIKEETMPDGGVKLILKHKASGKIVQRRKS